MTVVSFYFWMIKAEEKYDPALMFHTFLKIINDYTSWLELDELKFT